MINRMDNKIVILGQIPSKSNSYRIFTFYDKRAGNYRAGIAKTPDMKKYEKDFVLQFPSELKGKNTTTPFRLVMDVYYPDRRQDLDGCLKGFLDCLQAVEYIKDDRACEDIHIRRYIDKNNPRIEFELIFFKPELF